jgi:hypothetical protein
MHRKPPGGGVKLRDCTIEQGSSTARIWESFGVTSDGVANEECSVWFENGLKKEIITPNQVPMHISARMIIVITRSGVPILIA